MVVRVEYEIVTVNITVESTGFHFTSSFGTSVGLQRGNMLCSLVCLLLAGQVASFAVAVDGTTR